MNGLVSEVGKLRTGQVGAYNEHGKVVHLAPPAEFVPEQLRQLFDWIKTSPAKKKMEIGMKKKQRHLICMDMEPILL